MPSLRSRGLGAGGGPRWHIRSHGHSTDRRPMQLRPCSRPAMSPGNGLKPHEGWRPPAARSAGMMNVDANEALTSGRSTAGLLPFSGQVTACKTQGLTSRCSRTHFLWPPSSPIGFCGTFVRQRVIAKGCACTAARQSRRLTLAHRSFCVSRDGGEDELHRFWCGLVIALPTLHVSSWVVAGSAGRCRLSCPRAPRCFRLHTGVCFRSVARVTHLC